MFVFAGEVISLDVRGINNRTAFWKRLAGSVAEIMGFTATGGKISSFSGTL